jgi:queuosine precursor transporter
MVPGMSESRVVLARRGYSQWFVIVAAVFVTCLITANITAVKLVDFFGFILPAGVIVFPISYIAGDVLTEVYGFRRARLAIWLGFLCNLIAMLAIWLGGILPPAPVWDGQGAYEQILGYTPRLLLASFLAYLAGEFANSMVLSRMKVATSGRWLWSRTIGSTLVGQGLDSLVFVAVAFFGTVPPAVIASAIVAQWIFKSLYEAAATPLTYLVVNNLKRTEGVDVYDQDVSLNPLPIGR